MHVVQNHFFHALSEAVKGKESFDAIVSTCASRETMKKELVRRIRKRASQYMLAYQSIDLQSQTYSKTPQSQISHKK